MWNVHQHCVPHGQTITSEYYFGILQKLREHISQRWRDTAWSWILHHDKTGEPPLTPDSLIPIMLKSAEGWDQVAAFVALIMCRKMEIAREQQGRPIAAATQHPMPDLAIPRFCHQQPSGNGSRRRSMPVYFGDIRQPIHHLGLRSWDPKRRESVVAPSAHLSSRGKMGAERLPAPHSPLVTTQARCGNPRQGGGVSVGPIWHACIVIPPTKHRSQQC